MQPEQVLSRHVSATVDALPVDSLATCDIRHKTGKGSVLGPWRHPFAPLDAVRHYALGVKTVTQGVMELVTWKRRAPLPGSNVTWNSLFWSSLLTTLPEPSGCNPFKSTVYELFVLVCLVNVSVFPFMSTCQSVGPGGPPN
jgi:hypothetical protein